MWIGTVCGVCNVGTMSASKMTTVVSKCPKDKSSIVGRLEQARRLPSGLITRPYIVSIDAVECSHCGSCWAANAPAYVEQEELVLV